MFHPVLRRLESFRSEPLPEALRVRADRSALLKVLDDAVAAAVQRLEEKGFDSPCLKAFVVARINPLRFQRGAASGADLESTLEKMRSAAEAFDAGKVRPDQLATASGPPPDEE